MSDLFATLAAIAAWAASVALLTGAARRVLPKAKPAPPRRNFDVLAPTTPRAGATRGNVDAQTLADLRLARHIFGPKAGTVLTIRPEVRDARQ